MPQYNPLAKDYFNRVQSYGGSFANEHHTEKFTKDKINDFFTELADTGAWPAIAELYLYMGASFAGLLCKAKYIAKPNITWVNFVSGDYSPAGAVLGLTGDEGSKYGNTSVQPYSQVSDDIGVGAMIEDAPSPYGVIIGNLGIDHSYTVNLTWDDIRGGITARLKSSAGASQPRMTMPLVTGPTTAIRQGDDMRGIQGDQVEVVWPEPVSGNTNENTLHLFRRNNGSTPSYFDGRLSAQWITDGATPQQIIDLHSAINTLRNALQGPVSAPVFTEHPQSITIDEGEPLILSALATGVPSPTYGPWKKDGIDLPGTTNRILNRGTATLDMAGSYTVPAANVAGTVMSNAALVNVLSSWHPDTTNYLTRVETADGQALEPAVAEAWDVFLRQMADTDHPTPTAASHKIALQAGTAISLLGARTLTGALEPLYPGMPTPTNVGFVSGDYDRATGLKGDGASKYIDSNASFAFSDSTDHDRSIAVWVSEDVPYDFNDRDCVVGSSGGTSTQYPHIVNDMRTGRLRYVRLATNVSYNISDVAGFWGASVVSNQADIRLNEVDYTSTGSIGLAGNQGTILFFCRGNGLDISQTRLCIGQAGTAIDLEYMDSCLTTLISSIAAALS